MMTFSQSSRTTLSVAAAALLITASAMAGNTIDTYAGNGIGGYGGDGGPATSAQINSPQGVAVDSTGNIYIAHTTSSVIRKVDAATGIITTYAGDGTGGYSGDGGPAISAQLKTPQGVAVDATGNIYIADTGNSVIRKVDAATGIITTVAGNGTGGYSGDGGPATSAQLKTPQGVAVDSTGNIYIADTDNSVIRKVDAATGNISTIVGTGAGGYSGDGGPATAAKIKRPEGVAVDGAGNIYIADTPKSVIRKVDAATGIIDTVAGTGAPGYTGDGGPATAAKVRWPEGVAVDSAGNIFIADTANSVIRKVDAATGIIQTIAGTGVAGYSGDGGDATLAMLNSPAAVAFTGSGSSFLYISDTSNHRVRSLDAATGIITTDAGNGSDGYSGDGGPATAAELDQPEGVAVDSAGNLYIAHTTSSVIRKVDAGTGIITTYAGDGSGGYSGDGGPATSAQINSPQGVAVDSTGNIYIADTNNSVIRKVDAATGIITTYAGNGSGGYSGDGGLASAAELDRPESVAVDSAGNIYIADTRNSVIRKVDAATGIITTYAGNGTGGYSGDGGPATAAEFNRPEGVAVDAAGDIYIADTANSAIRKVDAATGIIQTVAGTGVLGYTGDGGPATAALLDTPEGVAVDDAGNMYIADTANSVIRKVDAATGIIQTIAGTGVPGYSGDGGDATLAMLNSPAAVAFTGSGSSFLYISDTSNHRVRSLDALIPRVVRWQEVQPQ